tara:strand:+ start:290 stop:1042 length:753 start_codon:yes stop_codon:yes gene_type:complete
MRDKQRRSSVRWWNKRNFWSLLIFAFFLMFIRISKGSIYRDIYYFVSKPFWPGQFQNDILLKSTEQEIFAKLIQLENDNQRLRELLSLQRVDQEETISASVISRQTGSWWKILVLNKGSKDGVNVGDVVVGPGGLLGVIDNISFLTSSVKLITSTDSKLGVWTERENIHGLLVGQGNDSPLLTFYLKEIDVKVGDFVFSSPASTLLPPNLPIGIIETIDKESSPASIATVKLLANPHAIDWVQIIKMRIE